MKNKAFGILGFFVILFLIVILMVVFGSMVKGSKTVNTEPRNAYMVHMIEEGTVEENVLCSLNGKCVGFAYKGYPLLAAPQIEIEGELYVGSMTDMRMHKQIASGAYCPGAASSFKCFKLTVLTQGETCPQEIEYLGMKASLYPESCISYK